MGYRSLQLRAASARFVNLLQQPAKRERMRTATGSHLFPHASQIRPITRTWLTSSVENLSMCDPCVHSATIEQLLPETSSNNASSKLVTALFDCHRPAWALPGKTQNKPRALPDNPDSSQADTTAQRNTALEMRGSRTQKRQEHKALVLI